MTMPNREPTETTNRSDFEPLPWSRALDVLTGSFAPCFLGTVRPDGRPHAASVGAAYHDGDLYFQTGLNTQKARNVAANPACTMSASFDGIDLVFEGDAERVTDPATVAAVAAVYREGGWPVEADGAGFTAPYNAPGTGPAPWTLFRVRFHTVHGVATAEPHGATRWRF